MPPVLLQAPAAGKRRAPAAAQTDRTPHPSTHLGTAPPPAMPPPAHSRSTLRAAACNHWGPETGTTCRGLRRTEGLAAQLQECGGLHRCQQSNRPHVQCTAPHCWRRPVLPLPRTIPLLWGVQLLPELHQPAGEGGSVAGRQGGAAVVRVRHCHCEVLQRQQGEGSQAEDSSRVAKVREVGSVGAEAHCLCAAVRQDACPGAATARRHSSPPTGLALTEDGHIAPPPPPPALLEQLPSTLSSCFATGV